MKKSDEISFVESVPYDFMLIPIGLLISGIAANFLFAFFSLSVAVVPVLFLVALLLYFKKRQHDINGVANKLPHEVIDNFMMWEKGDEIRLGRGSTILKLRYRGVLESGLLEFLGQSGGTHIYSARVFRYMDYENESLKRRRAKDSRTDKVGGNYKKFVESAQEELRSLMNENTDKEWNHTRSKTTKSQKSSQASKTR